ncbi:beta-ketoacyl synthase [Thozetella sp. PMI_491]|nr:beta-ketoacyl synthase [Thozetella sp. PMI_491]
MRFMALDIDAAPRPELAGQFDAVISTNCIHATQNATTSLKHLHHMLRPDGMLALVEFTQGMYWFDLVYGLLDGWWLFADGRRHALADTAFWDRSLRAAGFCNTSWSDGETQEAQTLRLICGFKSPLSIATAPAPLSKRAGVPFETVVWKNVDGLDLCADIYYPMEERNKLEAKKRPIALLLHGGGHVVFTRRDIHIKHVKTLLDRGFLPVSVDYRLCPEITMAEGPMTDACDALVWARTKLPHRVLVRPDIVIDRSRLVAVGWSAGGHLAMTLAYGALERNIAPPDAVLAFYCPTNFEDDWWKKPIYPKGIREPPGTSYDLLEGIQDKPVRDTPILFYADPRWRIIIHYNWTAQLVPLLVGGLPKGIGAASTAGNAQDWAQLPWPNSEAIRAVSPRAQVELGRYRTPTFIVHGERDDLIPCQQSRDMVDALTSRNIEAVLAAPRDAGHAFDLWTDEDPSGSGWEAVREAFEWISDHVFI